MIATHLSEVVKTCAAELLSRQDVSALIDHAKQSNETVVAELIPNVVQAGDVQKVLQHLLRERIPIRDMVTILETMADFAGRVKDNEQMGELVRAAIARTITRQYAGEGNKLTCVTVDPALERSLLDSVQHTAGGAVLALEPGVQQPLVDQVQKSVDAAVAGGRNPVLLCSSSLRLPLRKLIERYIPQLPVMAFNEVAAKADVEFVGQVAVAA
jgi:flagellar biosynthesis protein FlhA